MKTAISSPTPDLQDPNSQVSQTYGYPMSVWDVSRVTSLKNAFYQYTGPSAFYQYAGPNEFAPYTGPYYDLSQWDVSNVTDMSGMFSGANNFNSDLLFARPMAA